MLCQEGNHLSHHLLERRSGIAFSQIEKHAACPVQNLARMLVSRYRILEIRLGILRYDCIHLGCLLVYAELDGTQIVFI